MSITTQTNSFNLKLSRLRKPLKVKVLSSLHGYGYVFRDQLGRLITSQIGLLPNDFNFDKQTAELYALAQAARRLQSPDLTGFRVALVCSSLPFADQRERRAA